MTNINKSTLAKQVTFENYFSSKYGVKLDPSKREVVILDPTRDDKKPSISINFQKQLYNDFANGVGGSIIDWLIHKEGATFCEACDALLNGSFSFCRPITSSSLEPTEPTQVITAIVPIWSYALKNYLEQERCIPKEVYQKYLKEIRYTRNGKAYYAIGLRTLSGWEIKNAKIKSAIPCKDISLIKNESHRLVMFEGMMDFLSYIAMYEVLADDSDYVILNSLSLRNRALPLLKDYESVYCYYDNDQKGHDASIEALEVWESLGKDRTNFGFYAPFIKGKDLNEQWVKECQRRNKTV